MTGLKMKTMAISEFKTHALKIIDQLSKNHETIIITKRGKPLAKLLPYDGTSDLNKIGFLWKTRGTQQPCYKMKM